jgi:hypothetical protein
MIGFANEGLEYRRGESAVIIGAKGVADIME